MRINHNLMALNANRYLSSTGARQQRSMEKISSGLRINSASDDAAGLAISEKMRAQISGLDQAESNAQDGISLIQTAEGALSETHSILQRMRELAVQSANDTNTTSERAEMQKEVDELAKEITRISNNTEFNSQKLVNGGMETGNIGALKFHIGANAGQDISLSLNAMDAKSLGVSRDLVASATGTTAGDIDSATFSGTFGAGVINGATVTASYTAEVVAVSAVAAEWNSGAVTGLGAADGDFTFNGVTVSVTTDGAVAASVTGAKAVSIGIADGADAAATATAVLDAIAAYKADGATADGSLDNFTFGGDGTGITIVGESADGDANNALTIGGSIGITKADTTVDGVTAVAGESATVTLTSDQGHNQTLAVDGTATSLSVTTGNFQGMSFEMAGANTLADIAGGDDTVTIAATSTVAAAATFENGALTNEAVAEAGINVSSQAEASDAITVIDDAITTVSGERSKLGAYQNRLEHTITSLTTTSENVQASESRIRDVDIAKEMMNYTKLNILQQAAQSMLAQANQAPQGVLKLLG